MSPRTGRPKSPNPKDHDIKVRVDAQTNERLQQVAKRQGTTRAQVIRRAIEQFLAKEK